MYQLSRKDAVSGINALAYGTAETPQWISGRKLNFKKGMSNSGSKAISRT